MLWFGIIFPTKTTALLEFMGIFRGIHHKLFWDTSPEHTRSTDASGCFGRNGGEGEFADGDGSSETSSEARGPNAAAAGADGEEVEVVAAGLGAAVNGLGDRGEAASEAVGVGVRGGKRGRRRARVEKGSERPGVWRREEGGGEGPEEGLEGLRRRAEGDLRGGDGGRHRRRRRHCCTAFLCLPFSTGLGGEQNWRPMDDVVA